ncbi:MAG: hypothetical protein RL023_529 [Candidatus Parcubacteria bacterium]|jgi:hypothetical protein
MNIALNNGVGTATIIDVRRRGVRGIDPSLTLSANITSPWYIQMDASTDLKDYAEGVIAGSQQIAFTSHEPVNPNIPTSKKISDFSAAERSLALTETERAYLGRVGNNIKKTIILKDG